MYYYRVVTFRYCNTGLLLRVPAQVVHRGCLSHIVVLTRSTSALLYLGLHKVSLIYELKNHFCVFIHIRIPYVPPMEPALPPLYTLTITPNTVFIGFFIVSPPLP